MRSGREAAGRTAGRVERRGGGATRASDSNGGPNGLLCHGEGKGGGSRFFEGGRWSRKDKSRREGTGREEDEDILKDRATRGALDRIAIAREGVLARVERSVSMRAEEARRLERTRLDEGGSGEKPALRGREEAEREHAEAETGRGERR